MVASQPYAWLRQAESDLSAANRCLAAADDATFCQAIAKFQQEVEKSVKSIVAALNDQGVFAVRPGSRHMVDQLVSALVFLPRRPGTRDLQVQIRSLLDESVRAGVAALCLLAPRLPPPGQLYRRNTEYPYQNGDGSWRAPSDSGSFTNAEVGRFRQLATRLLTGASRIVAAAYR